MAGAASLIDPDTACAYLSRFRLIDPTGEPVATTLDAIARRCVFYLLPTVPAPSVVAVRDLESWLWCDCAAGSDLPAILASLEQVARYARRTCVAWQTARPGLVRIARRHGYRVLQPVGSGWIMLKAV